MQSAPTLSPASAVEHPETGAPIPFPAAAKVAPSHGAFAGRFAAMFGGSYCYRTDRAEWLEWDGPPADMPGWNGWPGSWRPARRIRQRMGDAILDVLGPNPAGAALSKWDRLQHRDAALTLARDYMDTEALWPDENAQWDALPHLLGLPYGKVADLSTGEAVPGMQVHRVTMRAGAIPAAAVSPAWARFLDQFTGGDPELRDALQLAVGNSLLGNPEQRVEIISGQGSTGKGVFLRTVGAALGDYAGVMAASVLNGREDQHPADLAAVIARRFILVPEVQDGAWRASILKAISGGDRVSVRAMRKDPLARGVLAGGSLWITTNSPPAARLMDSAMRRRLRVWPMETRPKVEDIGLGDRLQRPKALRGVLAWCMEGAARYAALDGGAFPEAVAVAEASADYFESVDTFAGWFGERCDPTGETLARTLFTDYREWCEAEGQTRHLTRTSWGSSMRRVSPKRHGKAGSIYECSLRDPNR